VGDLHEGVLAVLGIRLVIPGDAEWPGQLDVLGDARPWALWVRGQTDLRFACLRSVSVVGTRAATGYGTHVSGELAITLAEAGWTIVSGGAMGTKTPATASGYSPRLGSTSGFSTVTRPSVGAEFAVDRCLQVAQDARCPCQHSQSGFVGAESPGVHLHRPRLGKQPFV
jgi:hypothetical protein